MKLFLASEVVDHKSVETFENYVGGIKNKNIIYVPTASNAEESYNYWTKDDGNLDLIKSKGANIKVLQLEEHKSNLNINFFENIDILFMSWGCPGYLMYWIKRVGLDLLMPQILQKTIYLGTSAGSMVTTKSNLNVAEWYIGEQERGASVFKGLGLVDFEIYPHYEDHLYDQIKSLYKGKKLYLLKNGEEIIVEDDKITVVGEERIITNE